MLWNRLILFIIIIIIISLYAHKAIFPLFWLVASGSSTSPLHFIFVVITFPLNFFNANPEEEMTVVGLSQVATPFQSLGKSSCEVIHS